MTPIRQVAVVGTGVIGASWAAQFLAAGLSVVATDPAPGAEDALHRAVARHWPTLTALGLADGADPGRLRFVADTAAAVAEADFVQENGPERESLKQTLFRVLDDAAPAAAVIASSSSGLLISRIQGVCPRHPERIVLGHPFNPPHLIPLVEVVGGDRTDPAAIDTALAFYRAIGKRPIRVRKEVRGHVANRLQAALWREAMHLVATGVASVEDVDTAIAQGPGLRWALLGPFLNMALSGGPGGMRHTLDHLGPPMAEWWDELGSPSLDATLCDTIVNGVADELRGRILGEIEGRRDIALLELLSISRRAALDG